MAKSKRQTQYSFLDENHKHKYSIKFYIQIAQITIQNDHLHLLIRTKRRSHFQNFFRVVAGQIAQIFYK